MNSDKKLKKLESILYGGKYVVQEMLPRTWYELEENILDLIDKEILHLIKFSEIKSIHIKRILFQYIWRNKEIDFLENITRNSSHMKEFLSSFPKGLDYHRVLPKFARGEKCILLDLIEKKLRKDYEAFLEIGKLISVMVHSSLLEEKHPLLFKISKMSYPTSYLTNSVDVIKNKKTVQESLIYLDGILRTCRDITDYNSPSELSSFFTFNNITHSQYMSVNIKEKSFTNQMYVDHDPEVGQLVEICNWQELLNNKLNEWIFLGEKGDLNNSVVFNIMFELKNIIPKGASCYECVYDHSKNYIRCHGFEFIWVYNKDKYVFTVSLDD